MPRVRRVLLVCVGRRVFGRLMLLMSKVDVVSRSLVGEVRKRVRCSDWLHCLDPS